MSQVEFEVVIIDSVEDDLQILESMLSEEYKIEIVNTKEAAADAVAAFKPDVVILNPALEGLNVGDICNQAKELNPRAHVIFLSDIVGLDASIEAYELGADDFIPKPYNPVELYHKVKSQIDSVSTRKQMNASMEFARTAAFSAMESNSEMGIILRYMEESISSDSFDSLAIALNTVAANFGVRFIIQFRGVQGTLNFGCDTGSFEAMLLTKSLEKGKIIEGAHKVIVNEKQVSLLVKNMPAKDDPKYGRLKDNLAMIVNSTDARINTLNKELQLEAKREQGVQSTIENVKQSMARVQEHLETHEANIWTQINSFRVNMEDSLMTLGLHEQQEEAILQSLDEFIQHVTETEKTKEILDLSFRQMLADLDNLD